MFFTEEKLSRRIDELARWRYRDHLSIDSFQAQTAADYRPAAQPRQDNSWTAMHLGESWSGVDQYLWLKVNVQIPSSWRDKTVMGLFDFGTTGAGHNSGFESLLYLDGTPFQGVDSNHKEVFFPSELTGQNIELVFCLWSGLGGMEGYHKEQRHELTQAQLVWLDEATDDLYFTAQTMIQTIQALAPDNPDRPLLLTALDRSFRCIDWRSPGSDAFYDSIQETRQTLHDTISQYPKHHPVTIHCLGHTHIDVAWLWRLRHTRDKAARSLATVLRLMERYPDYLFLQTQPQLIDYLRKDYPDLYAQIKERVREGRIEVDGGMWLEADCNLPSGESLVRQILMGSRFLQREFGVRCEYLWLPDVFGYSWALPQILRKSGLSTFMTTKISWNQYNRMPHDTFWWRGIDGTEVLTQFITTPPPSAPKGNWRYVYEGDLTPKTVLGAWDAYRDKALNTDLLISYGFGDGGGGVNRDMLEMRRRIDSIPGLPRAVPNTARDYFRKLHDTIAASDSYVHTWDGELYLEYHRGTYTSQAYNKRMNRKLELRYRQAEWLAAFAAAERGNWDEYPASSLAEGWKILLRNQFHDIIPGSSIHEVYEDSRLEYQEAEQLAAKAEENALSTLVDRNEQTAWTVFNPAPWTANDIIAIDDTPDLRNQGRWVDESGPLTAVHTDNKWFVRVPSVPPMGFKTIWFDGEEEDNPVPSPSEFQLSDESIRTPFYQVTWDKTGHLTQIRDIEAGRDVLAPHQFGNVLQVFEDKPLRFDAWDIDIFYQEKSWTIKECREARVVESNSLRVVVRFHWVYQHSQIWQDMIVYADNRRIDFVTTVDWHEHQQLLKVAFPVFIRSTEATYDIQFGNVKRPTHWNTSWDRARFESVGHQWADLSERGYGVSLLNDCKYGYDIRDNVIRLSLIKSAIQPDQTADEGLHHFTYSLFPHSGDWLTGGTVQSAFALNSPFLTVSGQSRVSPGKSFVQLSSDTIMVDAVKQSEDRPKDGSRLILRLHDFSGGRQTVHVKLGINIDSWQLCNLLEEPIGEKATGEPITLEFGPYEVHTILVDLSKTY